MRALYSGTDSRWRNDLSNSLALSVGKKLTYTPTVSGNQRQFTVMCNVRRTQLGGLHYIFSGGTYCYWYFDTDDTLRWNGTSAVGAYHTTRKFRDTEWMFLGLAVDTVARTIKMVVNDEEIDLWDTQTPPTQNAAVGVNLAGTAMQIGEGEHVLSDFVLLDGEVLTPQEMINYRTQNVPFGNNVITTTKKFTTEGQQERFLALHKNSPQSTLTKILDKGQYVERDHASWDSIYSDVLPSTGLIQVEYELLDTGNLQIFVGPDDDSSNTGAWSNYNTPTGIYAGGNAFIENNNGVESGLLQSPAPAIGQIISIQLNLTSRKFYYSLDGVSQVGDPTSGGGGITIQYGDVRLYNTIHSLSGAKVNFGQADYKYPVAGYGPLKEPAKSDLKRCKLLPTSGSTPGVLSERGLRNSATGASFIGAYSNFVLSSGKIYFEAELENPSNSNAVGIAQVGNEGYSGNEEFVGGIVESIGLYQGNSLIAFKGGANIGTFVSGTASQTLTFAVDLDDNKFWMGADGIWQDGNPATGTGGHTITDTAYRVMVNSYDTGVLLNFGDSPWKETPPTGFVGPAHVGFDTLRAPQSDGEHLEYGPNGGQLLFENGGQIGEIKAGNLVTWTPTGITSDDQLTDTPGDPYPILAQIRNGALGISHGGTRLSASGVTRNAESSLTMSSGKWYWEVTISGGASPNQGAVGIIADGQTLSGSWYGNQNTFGYYGYNGQVYSNGSGGASGATYTTGDVIGIALDFDANEIEFFKNNVSRGKFPVTAGLSYVAAVGQVSSAAGSNIWDINFGQKPFAYTPPTDFKEIKSSNLETPQHHGRDKFDVNLRTGTGADAIILTPFDKTGLIWTKNRTASNEHILQDRLRGAGKELYSSLASAEATRVDSVKAFNDGQIFIGDRNGLNNNGNNFVDWIFGNDGTEVTNNDGTIPSQVIVDSSGFMSLVIYTADGTAGMTVGHGLPDTPDLVIVTPRSFVGSRYVYTNNIGMTLALGHYLILDGANGLLSDGSANIHNGVIGATVLNTGGNAGSVLNLNSENFVAFCVRSVASLSKVFQYTGTGSGDGPNVVCGFKPRWILFKQTNASRSWLIYDCERNEFNPVNTGLYADLSNAESSSSTRDIDITANGFKIRGTANTHNASGGTYIGFAIADVAGGGNLPAILGN
ncbi:hypothetical protein WH95_00475 [Kiloniella litopenaei]|uniref:B30.2/SPRY domain-containing protein n=1 Tax=Kiloniella litopenaei TaxID=1549748 RepID=A0A0M2RAB6_9PROT|nr:SPRY domain-containing protein [Kiloniella litopenaei]KKJ78611.1 hypothetical protein WH95_00475 [Kiloniella litopenaei]